MVSQRLLSVNTVVISYRISFKTIFFFDILIQPE